MARQAIAPIAGVADPVERCAGPRAADTVADTQLVALERRFSALGDLRTAILSAAAGHDFTNPDFRDLDAALDAPAGRGSPAERALLQHLDPALKVLRKLPHEDRRLIGEVLEIIIGGQELDLSRFGSASAGKITALETDADLDAYTYRVAGCVGEFWTRMCLHHVFPPSFRPVEKLLADGVRFGKGLQLVNILRDIPGDLRSGRCYIPRRRLMEAGLAPEDLLYPNSMARFRPFYNSYLHDARQHLAAGWEYTCALPRRPVRLRLACAWPILIGVETLSRLRHANVLDGKSRIRVSRSEVRGIMLRSVACCPFPARWSALFPGE